MNLLYGQIVELLEEAQSGDRVLVCDGIAPSKVEPSPSSQQLCNTPVLPHSNTRHAGLQAPNEAADEPGSKIS
jgi:hypothetical protein